MPSNFNNRKKSDHLLLTAKPVMQGNLKDDFFDKDWSLAWSNFLFQEVGSYTVSTVENFPFEKLREYSFVYLPVALNGHLGIKHSAVFKSYLESGGTLVVEGPVTNGFDFSRAKFFCQERIFRRITGLNESFCPQLLADHLTKMSFQTRGWEIKDERKELSWGLKMDDQPVLFKERIGRGTLLSLGFNFGLLLVALQQGIPAQNQYRLRKLFGTQTSVIEPEDLVPRAEYLDNPVPSADLFERFLFKVITSDQPAPRWWYFPENYSGAVISTHDEEALGADTRLKTMCQTEKAMGVRGTFFIISDSQLPGRWQGDDSLRLWAQGEGPEIALHWNRFKKHRLKIRRFRLGLHEELLSVQKRSLENQTGKPIRVNRNHYLALGDFYDEHFKALAGEGILFDSTYGPNQGGRGYLFGTSYPYYGLTWEGANSGVLELPFVTQELWGKADLSFLKKLITESDEQFHQCLVINFHPHYTVLQEEGREMWLGALRFAQEKKQWIPAMGEFFQFVKKRSENDLNSVWDESKGILECTAKSEQEHASLALAHKLQDGRRLSKVMVDGYDTAFKNVFNAWFEESIFSFSRGTHKVKVMYEG